MSVTVSKVSAQNFSMDFLNTKSMKTIFRFELYKVKPQDKDDVKQDAIVRIMKSLKSQEVELDKLPAFCQTIIKRTVVDYYRKSNRMVDKNSTSVFFCDGSTEDSSSEGEGEGFWVESEDHNYSLSDVRVDFETNRDNFTPTEQQAIEYLLYNAQGMAMSLAEIARELKINKSHTTRAMNKLKTIANS